MTLILSGTDGLSDIDGSASTPPSGALMLIRAYSSLLLTRLHSLRVVLSQCASTPAATWGLG
jgi:hypothetical protein